MRSESPDITPDERSSIDSGDVDREFRALMEGLRTTLPGAQVLVAFLLVLPVQASFDALTSIERICYYVAFGTALAASMLLIAPSVHQRMRTPFSGVTRRTRAHLHHAVNLTIAGTIALLIALIAVAYLVTSLVYGSTAATLAAVVVAGLGSWSWIYVPVVAFNDRRPHDGDPRG